MNRNDEIIIIEVEGLSFNGMIFSEIHIPIKHINFDSAGNQSNTFTAEQAANLFGKAINGVRLLPDGSKEESDYFVYLYSEKSKKYKFVFRIKRGAIYIHVITLFRTR